MCANEFINAKARYETLHNAKLGTEVNQENNITTIGQILKEVNYNGCLSFWPKKMVLE